jgi:hypothetical protein
MPMPMSRVGRSILDLVIALLQALLLTWIACAPIVWIVRDGLGPDSVDSGWAMSAYKFAVMWGTPALVLAVPLFVLARVRRNLGR